MNKKVDIKIYNSISVLNISLFNIINQKSNMSMIESINTEKLANIIEIVQFIAVIIVFIYGGMRTDISTTYKGYSKKIESSKKAKPPFRDSARKDILKLESLQKGFLFSIIDVFLISILILELLIVFQIRLTILGYLISTILMALGILIALLKLNRYYNKKLRGI